MKSQSGGGSVGQSLRWVDPAAPEQTGSVGADLLVQRGLVARPVIGGSRLTRKRRGGFIPSIMTGPMSYGMITGPLAVFEARKMLSRKNRRGGGKKGNAWLAQKEEAKAILGEIGNPSAKNVLAYAAARRRGTANAESFLNAYRQRKVKQAQEFSEKRMAKAAAEASRKQKAEAEQAAKEAEKAAKEAEKAAKMAAKEAEKAKAMGAKEQAMAAKRAEKEAEKAAKKAEREAAKAAKAAARNETRRAKQAARNASKKVKEAPKPVSNERPPTQLQLRRQAEANAAAARAEMKKAKPGQTAWMTLIDEAQKKLEAEANGKATRKNAMRLASMIKKGENTGAFLANFRTRVRKTEAAPKPKTPPAPVAPAPPAEKPKGKTTAYTNALRTAYQTLREVGAPLAPNAARFASMTMKGQNTSAWLENFKSRRPKTNATAKAAKKPKTAKKALTAVKESNENNMQGYEENFESEKSNE